VDYDICERCETQDCHNRTHVFLKIHVPIPPLANPRTPCTTVLYPGMGPSYEGTNYTIECYTFQII
jgi:hypothetical protein